MPLALPHAQKIFGIQKICESTIIDRPGIVSQQSKLLVSQRLQCTAVWVSVLALQSSVYFPSYFR